MQVAEGSYKDWKKVSNFHYRSHHVAFRQKIFVLRRGDEICGAIVYTCPNATAQCRNKVFQPTDMKELNEKVTRIARVVVHPKYRTIGAGVNLVRESLLLCGKYNPFAERAGMKRICKSRVGQSVLDAVAALEKLGWIPFMLAVPKYNKRMLKEKVDEVKSILAKFSFPYIRRIAGQHSHFTRKDYEKWLKEASINQLSLALIRLAQLNQTKVYLFWEKS